MKGTMTASAVTMLVVVLPAQVEWTPKDPAANRSNPLKVELGRFLFDSKELSDGGKASCATCHDPDKSFVDGRADSVGILDIGIGRNSPTLFGTGHIDQFRDPDQARVAKPGKRPKVLSLEERCLKPLENELEMGHSVKTAVKALRAMPRMRERFDKAFGGRGGVTRDRLGKALAAFVRTIQPPRAPYRQFLDGDQNALTADERRGLLVFKRAGCDRCHSGPALSDGLMHVVDPPHGFRIRSRQRAAAERRTELLRRDYAKRDPEQLAKLTVMQLAKEAEESAARLPGGGGYDASQLEVQTATLWDVAKTRPYFRDGSIKTLREAVTLHLREMRIVAEQAKEVRKTLKDLEKGGKRAPRSMQPKSSKPVAPPELTAVELDAILAFLRALSTRA